MCELMMNEWVNVGWLFLFYGTSTLVYYLISNPVYIYIYIYIYVFIYIYIYVLKTNSFFVTIAQQQSTFICIQLTGFQNRNWLNISVRSTVGTLTGSTLRIRLDLGVMAIKRYSTKLQDWSLTISRTLIGVKGSYSSAEIQWAYSTASPHFFLGYFPYQ